MSSAVFTSGSRGQRPSSTVLQKPSRTNFLNRNVETDRSQLLTDWEDAFSHAQIEQARSILPMFGLDKVYSEERPADGVLATGKPQCRE